MKLFVPVLALFLAPGIAIAQTDPTAPSSGAAESWEGSLATFFYFPEGDDFLVPIAGADRGALHLEARYQYEDRHTFSAWAGWRYGAGENLHLELVPMAGFLLGRTQGWAPGLEVSLSWKAFDLYSESEYVFDTEGEEGDYFYNWSQLTWEAKPWLSTGLSLQRTRLYHSEFEIDRGLFGGVKRGRADLTVYAFNLDGDSPFAIVAVEIGL